MKLLILDLDKTLWSHHNVTDTSPPYRRVAEDTVVDSRGEVVRLNPCARELLELAKSRGLLLAVASWNDPEKALAVLETMGLKEYFDVVVVEPFTRTVPSCISSCRGVSGTGGLTTVSLGQATGAPTAPLAHPRGTAKFIGIPSL